MRSKLRAIHWLDSKLGPATFFAESIPPNDMKKNAKPGSEQLLMWD